MKHVIHIYGASGSGTTTFRQKICNEVEFAFIDVDDYFWMPTDPKYTIKWERNERIKMLKEDIASADTVVISGSLVDWRGKLIPFFTLAIRIATDTNTRIERLKVGGKFLVLE